MLGPLLDVQVSLGVAGCKGFCTFPRVSKTWGFCSSSKSVGRRGTFEGDLQKCILCGKRSTRDMFIRAVRRSGRWFPERGCILERQIFSFGKMIWVTGAALRMTWRHFFVAGAVLQCTSDRWNGKIALVRGRWLCTQLSMFEGSLVELHCFWCWQLRKLRKSRRIASFLTLSSWKTAEVLQTCFFFDAVKVNNWGSLAE